AGSCTVAERSDGAPAAGARSGPGDYARATVPAQPLRFVPGRWRIRLANFDLASAARVRALQVADPRHVVITARPFLTSQPATLRRPRHSRGRPVRIPSAPPRCRSVLQPTSPAACGFAPAGR